MSIQDEDIGNGESSSRWGYMLSLVLVLLVISIQIIFFRGDYIWWVPYQPLSPLPWDKMSALAYLTFGSILYHVGFYLALYRGMKSLGFRYRDFEITKDVIWLFLMYVTYQVQLFVVTSLNFLDSLFWNAIRLIVFLWPSFCVILLGFLMFFLIRKILRRNMAS